MKRKPEKRKDTYKAVIDYEANGCIYFMIDGWQYKLPYREGLNRDVKIRVTVERQS